MRRISKNQVIWGGNYFSDYLPTSQGWYFWDKGQRSFSLADGELAWTSYDRALRVFEYPRAKALQDGKEHPTQKPVELFEWCLNRSKECKVIFDGFVGSGTTCVACERLDKKSIVVEVSIKNFDIACRRTEREVNQPKLNIFEKQEEQINMEFL